MDKKDQIIHIWQTEFQKPNLRYISRRVNVTKSYVWKILKDLPEYKQYMASLK